MTKTYVPWKPNAGVVKFFENMAKRKIPAGDEDLVRVSASPPTNHGKTSERVVTPGGISSTRLAKTAMSETNFKKGSSRRKRVRRKRTTVRKTSQKRKKATKTKKRVKKKSTSKKKKKNPIEKRLNNLKF